MDDDPLAQLDRPANAPCSQYCDGGFIWVTSRYAERLAPWPPPPIPPPEGLAWDQAAEEAAYAIEIERVRLKRVALAASVYPCPNCRPQAHEMWVHGHLAVGHNRAECSLCVDAVSPHRGTNHRRLRVVREKDRRDLE